MSKLWGHFSTVNKHKRIVLRLCFACGLYKQGLLHDLSKYSFTEFITGVRYYCGYRSPNGVERERFGYSPLRERGGTASRPPPADGQTPSSAPLQE